MSVGRSVSDSSRSEMIPKWPPNDPKWYQMIPKWSQVIPKWSIMTLKQTKPDQLIPNRSCRPLVLFLVSIRDSIPAHVGWSVGRSVSTLSEMIPKWPPNDPKWYQMTPNGPEWLPSYSQIISKGSKMTPNGQTLFPNGAKWLPNGHKSIPNGTKWFPNGPKWFLNDQQWFSNRLKWPCRLVGPSGLCSEAHWLSST